MRLAIPKLPYAEDALEPYISRGTLQVHHGKHHRAYVEKAKELAKEVRLADRSLEEIVLAAARQGHDRALFNAAAQAWNHAFYWRSMTPQGGGRPSGEVSDRIAADFGSYETFAERFAAAATGLFGSGWAWLALKDTRLEIVTTQNADTPLAHDMRPLLTLDVWEHAYYLDYQNRRADYVAVFLDRLVNWEFANANLGRPPLAGSAFDPLVERARTSTGL